MPSFRLHKCCLPAPTILTLAGAADVPQLRAERTPSGSLGGILTAHRSSPERWDLHHGWGDCPPPPQAGTVRFTLMLLSTQSGH